jgi:hypothetical protein
MRPPQRAIAVSISPLTIVVGLVGTGLGMLMCRAFGFTLPLGNARCGTYKPDALCQDGGGKVRGFFCALPSLKEGEWHGTPVEIASS